jgi:hypothetical protein
VVPLIDDVGHRHLLKAVVMSVTGGILLGAAELRVEERTATPALVRALQHELFAGGSRQPGPAALQHLNDLRTALGWLEVDSSGEWRWPS